MFLLIATDSRRGDITALAYMYDFLSQLSMTVKNEGMRSTMLPDELDGLAENVYIERFAKPNYDA